MKLKTAIQVLIGLLLAGGGFYFFFTNVNVNELWRNMAATPLTAVAGTVLFTLVSLWLRSLRWNVMLPLAANASRRDLFGIIMIGFMINNFIPARIGEAVRVVLLWKRNRFSLAASTGSVVLERIFDSVCFLSFIFIPIFFLPTLRANSLAFKFALPLAGAVGGVLLVLLLYALFPAWVRSTGRKFLPLFSEKKRAAIVKIATELVSNLDWIFSPTKCLAVLALSIALVSTNVIMMVLIANDRSFGVLHGMYGAGFAALGAAVPLTPGYFGTIHASIQSGLSMTGFDPDKAGAIAIISHAIGYVTVSVVGLYYFFRMKISFKDIGRAKESLKETAFPDHDPHKGNTV